MSNDGTPPVPPIPTPGSGDSEPRPDSGPTAEGGSHQPFGGSQFGSSATQDPYASASGSQGYPSQGQPGQHNQDPYASASGSQGYPGQSPQPNQDPYASASGSQGYPGQQSAGSQGYPGQQNPSQQGYGAAATPPPYGGTPGQAPYGGPGGPGGQPPYGGPGGPGGQPPYGGPGGPGSSGSSGKKSPVALIIGGAVLLLAIIIVVIVLVTRGGGDDPDTDPTGDPTGSETSESTGTDAEPTDLAPEAVVEAYLTALADGDAETALSYVDSFSPLDETLLTDEVLAVSNGIAPIADIEVLPPTEDLTYGGEIEATYTLGGTPVTTDFQVYGDEEDGYGLSSPGGTVYVPGSVSGVDPTINGVAVDGDSFDAFIGSYQLGTTSTTFSLAGTVDIQVTDPYESGSFSGVEVGLSEEATQVFHDTVKAEVDACIASTALAPGCGLDIPGTLTDGTVVTDGTVTRTLSGDAGLKLTGLNPEPGYDNPYFVRGDYIGSVDVTAECTQNGTTGTCTLFGIGGGTSLGAPTVDFSAEPKTVVWN